jgi:hypothetical protein
MVNKKHKQEKNSYIVDESEFKKVLKKIIQAPSLKPQPNKKKKSN